MDCVTNKPERFSRSLLKTLGIDSFFTNVIGGDTLNVKKPDPKPLQFCLYQHRVSVEECLMVGDSRTDIETAREAGVRVLCVDYGYNHGEPIEAYQPDAVCSSIHGWLAITWSGENPQ